MTVKIGTFTQCIRLSGEVYTEPDDYYQLFGTCSASEVLASLQFSIKSDVWSFGVVLYEIFTAGKKPYTDVGLHDANDIMRWLTEGHRLEQPELCPATIYEFMLDCWRKEPSERPDFEDIQSWLACIILGENDPLILRKNVPIFA